MSFHSDLLACCVLITSPHFCVNTLFGTPSGTTIIMAVHSNKDILMVPYEDLPNKDKDVIGKALEEFENKCLLSLLETTNFPRVCIPREKAQNHRKPEPLWYFIGK